MQTTCLKWYLVGTTRGIPATWKEVYQLPSRDPEATSSNTVQRPQIQAQWQDGPKAMRIIIIIIIIIVVVVIIVIIITIIIVVVIFPPAL